MKTKITQPSTLERFHDRYAQILETKEPSTLERFHDRYTQILETKEPTRTTRLTNLMDDLEQVYQIPMRKNEAFEQLNVRVMHLYRAVSRAKILEGVR